MKLEHLRAILWLRWRILRNRFRRGSDVANTLLGILLVLGTLASIGFFALALGIGLATLPEAAPGTVMLVWVGLTLAFLFFWLIGLVTDLQRSDSMSFKNLLHLPVSLSWVFLYNYVGSFVSLSIAICLPSMLGLALAMLIVYGPMMLLVFPLLAGFFVMVTALTYQLRGWLARLMENKRRGRTIVAFITIGFVLLMQVPNLINIGHARQNREERRARRQETAELWQRAEKEGPDGDAARQELERRKEEDDREDRAIVEGITKAAMVVPPGWLPYGVRASIEGRWLPGILCTLGMLAIGLTSLRLSYRSTMRGLVGAGGPGRGKTARPAHDVARRVEQDDRRRPVQGEEVRTPRAARRPFLVERTLPLVNERVSVIAMASLRSLTRAPEAKLLMLTPVILVLVFWMMFSNRSLIESLGRFASTMSFGAIALGMVSVMPLVQNMFGLDRAGFRAFVLSPAPRREILLGKNLAHAPLAIGIGVVALTTLQILAGGSLLHLVGGVLQLVSGYLLISLVGNALSILNPMRLREGTLKAKNATFFTILWHILALAVIPLVLSPLAFPALLEILLPSVMAPVFFPLLHAVLLGAVLMFYRWLLPRQGEMLQEQEQRILDVITRD